MIKIDMFVQRMVCMYSIHSLTTHISFQQILVDYILYVLHILEDIKKSKPYTVPKELTVFIGGKDIQKKI